MSDSQIAVQQPAPLASTQLASFLGIEKAMMLDTLKAQCFKGLRPEQVTDAQLAAFVSTANALQVNPLLPGFLYAFPERNGGITPILGPDGVLKKLDEFIGSGKLEGYECAVFPEDVAQKPTHATAKIYRSNGAKPAVYTAIFSEWVVSNSPTWNSKPRHMLWIRAIKQAARQVIHGLPMDADEYKLSQMLNVTENEDSAAPEAAAPPERPTPKPRATRGAAAAKEVVIEAEQPKVKPADDIQQAMKDREAKTQSQGGDANVPTNPANQAQPTAGAATPQVPSNPAPAATPVSRTFLNEGERVTLTAKVDEFKAVAASVDGQNCAAIRAILSGGYVGEVRQKEGGAKFVNNNTEVVPLPPWQVGATLKFTLFGKKASNGKVIPWVIEVGPINAEPEVMD